MVARLLACCYRYIWLLVLPFGIFPEASWWALLPVSVMSAMMLGLEDLACQLEDPFRSIPIGACTVAAQRARLVTGWQPPMCVAATAPLALMTSRQRGLHGAAGCSNMIGAPASGAGCD